MKEQKRKAIEDLIGIVNELDMSSITLLSNGANMLRAKEQLDKHDNKDKDMPDTLKAG